LADTLALRQIAKQSKHHGSRAAGDGCRMWRNHRNRRPVRGDHFVNLLVRHELHKAAWLSKKKDKIE
jgi:hypothetical protein